MVDVEKVKDDKKVEVAEVETPMKVEKLKDVDARRDVTTNLRTCMKHEYFDYDSMDEVQTVTGSIRHQTR